MSDTTTLYEESGGVVDYAGTGSLLYSDQGMGVLGVLTNHHVNENKNKIGCILGSVDYAMSQLDLSNICVNSTKYDVGILLRTNDKKLIQEIVDQLRKPGAGLIQTSLPRDMTEVYELLRQPDNVYGEFFTTRLVSPDNSDYNTFTDRHKVGDAMRHLILPLSVKYSEIFGSSRFTNNTSAVLIPQNMYGAGASEYGSSGSRGNMYLKDGTQLPFLISHKVAWEINELNEFNSNSIRVGDLLEEAKQYEYYLDHDGFDNKNRKEQLKESYNIIQDLKRIIAMDYAVTEKEALNYLHEIREYYVGGVEYITQETIQELIDLLKKAQKKAPDLDEHELVYQTTRLLPQTRPDGMNYESPLEYMRQNHANFSILSPIGKLWAITNAQYMLEGVVFNLEEQNLFNEIFGEFLTVDMYDGKFFDEITEFANYVNDSNTIKDNLNNIKEFLEWTNLTEDQQAEYLKRLEDRVLNPDEFTIKQIHREFHDSMVGRVEPDQIEYLFEQQYLKFINMPDGLTHADLLKTN